MTLKTTLLSTALAGLLLVGSSSSFAAGETKDLFNQFSGKQVGATASQAEAAPQQAEEAVNTDPNLIECPDTLAGTLTGKWSAEEQGIPITIILNLVEGRLFSRLIGGGMDLIQEVEILEQESDSAAYNNGEDKPFVMKLAKKGSNNPYMEIKCSDSSCESASFSINGEQLVKSDFKLSGNLMITDLLPTDPSLNIAGYHYRGEDPSDGDIPEDAIERTDSLFGALTARWHDIKDPSIKVDIFLEDGYDYPHFVRILTPTSSETYKVTIGENTSATYYQQPKNKVKLLDKVTGKRIINISYDDRSMQAYIRTRGLERTKHIIEPEGGLYLNQMVK